MSLLPLRVFACLRLSVLDLPFSNALPSALPLMLPYHTHRDTAQVIIVSFV